MYSRYERKATGDRIRPSKIAMLCMPSPPQAGKTVLQQVHHFKVDVFAGDANTAAYRYYKKARVPRLVQLFSCRYVERDAT